MGVQIFFDALHEFGGPRHDNTDMCIRVALFDMAYTIGMFKLIETGREGDVYGWMPKGDSWKNLAGLDDPVLTAYSLDTVMLRSHLSMVLEGMKTWKGRGYVGMFREWRAKNPK